MNDKSKLKKIINVIVIIVVIIVVLILIMAELDRSRKRRVPITAEMYYKHGVWITAPFNLIVQHNSKRQTDLLPFPSMTDNFPQHVKLQSQWKIIRDEVLRLYNKEGMSKIKDDMFFQKIADDKWKKFYIKWYGDSLKDAREKLPFTTKLIDSIPEIQSAMLSVLEPGSVIKPHCGPYGGVIRYHLALVTAKTKEERDKCRIILDGEKYIWEEGKDVLFDDTCVHEVRNDSNHIRIVLFCDIKRDLGNKIANRINDFSCKIAKTTTRNNK